MGKIYKHSSQKRKCAWPWVYGKVFSLTPNKRNAGKTLR